MFDRDLIMEILNQILTATNRIVRRCEGIVEPNDFLVSNEGIDKLDAICMMLIAIGENLKNIDRITDGKLLKKFPEVDWKGAKGMRDIISHHYFDLNAEVVFAICMDRIPGLMKTIIKMKESL